MEALRRLEEEWENYDVFVLSLPVASGKSLIAQTIAKWRKEGARILTPTNILVEQYAETAEGFNFLKKKETYTCHSHTDNWGKPQSCARTYQVRQGSHCTGCHYVRKVRETRSAKRGVYNYHTYMALKLYSPVVIIDEAHKVIDTIRSLSGKKLWQDQVLYPDWVRTYAHLYKWLLGKTAHNDDKVLHALKNDLEMNSKSYLVQRSVEPYRGMDKDCLSLLPLDISNQPPIFWPKQVKKLVLMSGTISYKDIEAMGLQRRRVCYIDLPSPIPATSRPVIYRPVASMAYAQQDENLEKLAHHLAHVVAHDGAHDAFKGKGLIHVTYGLARKLRPYLPQERFLWHDSNNKLDVYRFFRETDEPRVLVGSGLYEGIDLYGEDYQWQIITKVPFPSLGEPAVRYLAEKDRVWYHWETMKSIIQACGRICRGPEDSGTTYILDQSWGRLYEACREAGLLPKWWLDAYKEYDVAPKYKGFHVPTGARQG